jgi:tRNA modification GTPase
VTQSQTIFALSSGRGTSGVAVIRLSGRDSLAALRIVSGREPPPRVAVYTKLFGAHGETLDRGLILYFAGPASVTGEDCAELHVHGGRAVVEAVLRRLGELQGLRPAEPGEFTRRAFLNGKLDLTRVEALSDLIAAETEMQRRLAVDNVAGAQERLYARWQEHITRCRAHIEADLDFSDEGDVPGEPAQEFRARLLELAEEIDRHAGAYRAAEIVKDGFRVVITGAPNVGKSSLLNTLARRDVAIVSDEPGTTRDLLEVALDLGGNKVVVVDTAGVREGAGPVESLGIERARAAAQEADLRLLLVDSSSPDLSLRTEDSLVILTKLDIAPPGRKLDADLAISSRTGEGIDKLLDIIGQRTEAAAPKRSDVVPSTLRHLGHLRECRARLRNAAADGLLPEFRAEELRLAGAELGRITGAVGVEEVLGEIFRTFCIGK